MADARKDKRTLLSLKIRYKSATLEDFIERYSSDISRGGVFINAKKPLAVGTLLKFEFMLQDESTLIHGVGRVVWRRDAVDADAKNPPGMGIKFIKMDSHSRSIVQRIATDSGDIGVFERGTEGVRPASDPSDVVAHDRTKVRHVSEFLASALEEGGAGTVAQREAQAGAERARQVSNDLAGSRSVAARGAFSADHEVSHQNRQSVADAPARGAMSAFGGSGLSAGTRASSAAAPAMEELDAADDFLDDETTKIHDQYDEGYAPDADATVIAKNAALHFAAEKRKTPVVPAAAAASSPLESAVPDLFSSGAVDSFGPAPGEFLDPRLLDPAVETVPPPPGSVPEAPGIPAEAFTVSQASEPVWTTRPTPPKQARPGLVILLVSALLLGAGAVAIWQLGLTDDLMELAAPYLGQGEAVESSARVVTPAVTPKEPSADSSPAEAATEPTAQNGEVGADEAKPGEASEPTAQAAPSNVADAGMVKFEVVSQPSGAFVSVDGKRAGRTPVEIEHAVGATLSIYSKARGHLGRRQRVTVGTDQEAVSFTFVPLPYVVQVVTSPAGAQASAVGGGAVVTPGELQFRTMPRSRTIVVTMVGYEPANATVRRASFVEETRRMVASVNLALQKEGAAPAVEASAPEPAEEPAPSEEKTNAEPVAEPAPAPSETDAADAP